ncbi:hypothetical protein B0H67DRAFT_485387 [Lasiosphaeris hirsuta]|uniref:Uncharacterized protein n=1 Tax=Lasiosphaeris hirsuta TaxID=260670 RepID=A0AA40ANL9_9PEZI|nr:hypothetical protein B0H67DRAFT_485387 [Lasiosphaeris hirsuta]
MSAAVAVPLSAISQLGGVLPPSALVQNSPRHGRSRGMSIKGKNGKGRGYSVVEDRDVTLAKALLFVLKRTITETEAKEDDEGEKVVADAEGWVGVDDVLAHPKLAELEADLEDVQRVAATSKARFTLRQLPDTADEVDDAESWEIRRITTNRDSLTAAVPVPVPVGEALTLESDNLPEFVVYETSYQRYPLLITIGAITHAPGGTPYLSFEAVTVSEDGTESRQAASETADVSIWIDLKAAIKEGIDWQRTDAGIITSDEVPKSLWKKAVARRPDIGVLFEDGEVRKEVPAGMRGKGAKGKARKGKGGVLKREGSDDSGSASEE